MGMFCLISRNNQVSRLTPNLLEQLRKMNPNISKTQPLFQIQKNKPADDATAMSVALKEISHLSGSQWELLRKALELQYMTASADSGLGMATGNPFIPGTGSTIPYPPASMGINVKLDKGVLDLWIHFCKG